MLRCQVLGEDDIKANCQTATLTPTCLFCEVYIYVVNACTSHESKKWIIISFVDVQHFLTKFAHLYKGLLKIWKTLKNS